MRAWLDDNGRPLGWAKAWSDAPGEWWHIRFRPGVWEPRPDPGPDRAAPRLAEGSGGPCQRAWVQRVQLLLDEAGAEAVGAPGAFALDARGAQAVRGGSTTPLDQQPKGADLSNPGALGDHAHRQRDRLRLLGPR